MKYFIMAFSITSIFLLNACGTVAKFPVSTVTPAAVISAKKGMNKQSNFTLEVKANNLATAERVTPAGNNYSVWIVSLNNGVKNVGQLNVSNGRKVVFNAITPFDFNEVFITVEDRGDMSYPSGVEISRTRF